MSENAANLSDAGWSQIKQVVHDEAMRARVAASFLPLFGPLAPDVQAVPKNSLEYPELNAAKGAATQKLAVLDYETMRLTSLTVNIYLKNAQLADPELTSALMMFRRGAEILARLEDTMIFNGQEAAGKGPKNMGGSTNNIPPVYGISGGGAYDGLQDNTGSNTVEIPKKFTGQNVFEGVVSAVQALEGQGHQGPFACVMGDNLFAAITRPVEASMVLPRDSIMPFLDGPLLRSNTVKDTQAVVVSLQGASVEIVVPKDISVRYLQTTIDSEHIFQIKQKYVLRVKDASAVATIKTK